MRKLPVMEGIWRSGDMTGPRRPMIRATVQTPAMAERVYALMSTFNDFSPSLACPDVKLDPANPIDPLHGRKVCNIYADFLFSAKVAPRELPNIKALTWSRSLDTDAATMTLILYNTIPRTFTETAPKGCDLDHPGAYTYNYGSEALASRWGHVKNVWSGLLMPDNVIRTYEGYGFDPSVPPESDANLAQTGTWLIDTVKLTALGMLEVSGRDMARLLLDHQSAVPVVPFDFTPLAFQSWWDDKGVLLHVTLTQHVGLGVLEPGAGRLPATVSDHSVRYWAVGTDGDGGPGSIAHPDDFFGHHPGDVLDDDPGTYWLSVGNGSPRARYAYEWVELAIGGTRVDKVVFRTVKTGYTAYVSVKVGGIWRGAKRIDYHEDSIGRNGSNIAYVASTVVRTEGDTTVSFTPIPGATHVRLTLGNLQNFRTPAGSYHYRGAIRTLRAYSQASPSKGADIQREVDMRVGPAGSNPGRYSDFTDIVKLACAWAGLYWPSGAKVFRSDGTSYLRTFTKSDPVLGAVNGRVWGDFENTGTYGPQPIPTSAMAAKTLMDVIGYIREMIGFIFFVDETGAAQWRLPNIYKVGSLISDASEDVGYVPNGVRKLDERQVLLSLEATLDSHSLRELILINSPGVEGYVAPGYNPNPVGLRRVLNYTDGKYLTTKEEIARCASLIAVRQMFTYRTDNIVIAGFPGIQIDDQIRVMERMTSEGNIHYVNGVASDHDLEAGTWTYTLQTHWLGEKPEDKWFAPIKTWPSAIVDALAAQASNRDLRRLS